MAELTSDHQAIALLGLNETQVGHLFSKTRQAINTGLDRERYFKDHELTTLLLWLRSQKPDAVTVLEDHIRATRPETAKTIISAYDNFSSLKTIVSDARRIVLVIPGYPNFSQTYRTLAHALRCEVAQNPAKYAIVVVLESDKNAFVSDVLQTADHAGLKVSNRDIHVAANPKANALPYMLFCDYPSRLRVPYVFVGERIEQIDGPRGEEIYQFLVRDLPAKRPARPKTAAYSSPTRAQRQKGRSRANG